MTIQYIDDSNDMTDPVRFQWKTDGDLWMGQGLFDSILMTREMAYDLHLKLQEEFEGNVELREVANG